MATRAFAANLLTPAGQMIGIAFSPDGHSMAATSNTGDAFVWDTKWLSPA